MDQIKSIVVPTDFSQQSQSAVARAIMLARQNGASIHLIHAVGFPHLITPYEVPLPSGVWEGIRDSAKAKLEELRKEIETRGVETVTGEISESENPVPTIDAAVKAHSADLIVMGTHGHSGLKHAFLGSVAERTLRGVACPVLAVKEDEAKASEPIIRILVPVDFSAHSDHAVEVAAGLAKLFTAKLDVIHAFDLPRDYTPYGSFFGMELEEKIRAGATERLAVIEQRLKDKQLDVTTQVGRGFPSVVIAKSAEENGCQLIVMGTRGNTGLSHILLGSVAERTMRAAPCSVLAVKAEVSEK